MGIDNPLHIAFLLVLLLLVFGAKRLPEMGRSLGGGMRGFKDALSGEQPPASLTPVRVEREEQPRVAAPVPLADGASAAHMPAREEVHAPAA